MQSLPLFGIGVFFGLAGIGLFAMTLRKPGETVPANKAEQRALKARQTETTKLRIAAVVCVLVGAVLMIIS